jgi:hypothetical protein
MICQRCGTSISDWADYCPYCGHRTACVHNDDQLICGPCRYVAIAGSAVITSVADDEDRTGVRIIFDFNSDDPSVRSRYRFSTWVDQTNALTIHGGINPSRQWARRHRVAPGRTFRCNRREIVVGSCTPVIFEFPDLLNVENK